MRLLLDINVLLDVVLERDPWARPAAELLAALETNQAQGFVAGHTLPTVYYVVARSRDRDTAITAMHDLLRLLEVVPVEKQDFYRALSLPLNDFEDAVQAAAAFRIDAEYLVTRNEPDFKGASIATATPTTILSLL
ncbi:MAG: PIN domain-containing protein [Gemmatimonadota bacterium]